MSRVLDSPSWRFYRHLFSHATKLPIQLSIPHIRVTLSESNRFCRLLKSGQTIHRGYCPFGQSVDEFLPCGNCQAGLRFVSAPILLGPLTLGSLMAGPVATSSISPCEATRQLGTLPYGVRDQPLSDLVEARLLTPVITPDAFNQAERLLSCFALLFAARINRMLVEERHHDPSWVRKIQQELRQEGPLLPAHSPLHDSGVQWAFHRHTGLGFREYQSRWRLEAACARLLEPSVSRSMVITESGYPSQTALNNAFREFLGESPERYRQSMLLLDRQLAAWPKPLSRRVFRRSSPNLHQKTPNTKTDP